MPLISQQMEDEIVFMYVNMNTDQTALADMFGVSRRTIQRTLKARGVLRTQVQLQVTEERLLKTVKELGITPLQAVEKLTTSQESIARTYLLGLPKTELTALYLGTLFTLTEPANNEKEAANAIG